jgi:transposase InsO family protein
MSCDNPLWGAPRIHGELLKLGIDIAQSTVAKYMPRRRGPPSPGWRAFLRNHTAHIAAIDLFVVSTIGFKLLYALVILRLERRRLVWTNVTTNPTAEWIAQQITEAFPWGEAPRYLIRDRDTAYGAEVARRLRAMGIRDRPIAPRSPWQNGHVERLIGSIRRECLDHVVVMGERHLRHTRPTTVPHARISRSTRMFRYIDLRRTSVALHQSRGSAASIISTFGWHNRQAQVPTTRL